MRDRYRNALNVLPREVFDAVSEALDGRDCYLWVPASRNTNRDGRNAHIVTLAKDGYTAADIASRLIISERTVRRVLAKERNKQQEQEGRR